jgi:hypothetical protein
VTKGRSVTRGETCLLIGRRLQDADGARNYHGFMHHGVGKRLRDSSCCSVSNLNTAEAVKQSFSRIPLLYPARLKMDPNSNMKRIEINQPPREIATPRCVFRRTRDLLGGPRSIHSSWNQLQHQEYTIPKNHFLSKSPPVPRMLKKIFKSNTTKTKGSVLQRLSLDELIGTHASFTTKPK